METGKDNEVPQNEENEYIGNIWGWKLSFISLGIIVAMLLLMGIRYLTMDRSTIPESQHTNIEQDSLLNDAKPTN